MNLDQILSSSQRENPIQAGLLAVLLDGGRVVACGEISEGLLNMVPDLISVERRSIQDHFFLSKLSPKDLIFVEKVTVDELWHLAKLTGAQVALLSETALPLDLVDFALQEKDLRSAILSLRTLWSQIDNNEKQKFSFDGVREEKALFLDRDGVIIEDTDFVRDPAQVMLLPGVTSSLSKARELGYRLVVVTNQSGIGRGLISWPQYDQVTLQMQKLLAAEGVILDRILVAPFYRDGQTAHALGRRSLRKPRPGLIHQLISEMRIDVAKSVMVGDKSRDLISAALAGVNKLFLLKGSEADKEIQLWKQWPLLNRMPANTEMLAVNSWEEILKKI